MTSGIAAAAYFLACVCAAAAAAAALLALAFRYYPYLNLLHTPKPKLPFQLHFSSHPSHARLLHLTYLHPPTLFHPPTLLLPPTLVP